MYTFCDVLRGFKTKQKSEKKNTLEVAQYGLESGFELPRQWALSI